MKRWQPVLLAVAAVLLAAIFLILATTGSDRRAALNSTYARLAELRMQRLAPDDNEKMKGALIAGPDPQSGLLIASEAEAASRLEAFIRSIARDHKAEVQSISIKADPTNGPLPLVRGNLYLAINGEDIGAFVKSLESGPPAVFLESLRIAHRRFAESHADTPVVDLTTSFLVYRDVPANGKSTP